MPSPPNTKDESSRLRDLDRYAILATPPEAAYDRITKLAARLFRCPIAVLNFVAGDRQWFKSCIGLNFNESSRDVSICAWAILSDSVLVVPDARVDPRFSDNCFVTAEGGIRFYAGAPLVTPRGHNLGTLCVIDTVPRPQGLTADEISTISDLAALVMSELEARLIGHEAEQAHDLLKTTVSSVADGVITTDVEGRITSLNPVAQDLTGWSDEEARGKCIEEIFSIVNETTRKLVENPIIRTLKEDRTIGLSIHSVLVRKDGREIAIDDSGAPIRRGGAIVGGVLIFRDISVRRNAERLLEHREAQFRSTFAGAPLGMVIANLDGTFLESNQAYREITGYAEEELPAIDFISLTHPDEVENNRMLFRKLLAGEVQSYVLEKRIISKPGSLRWIRSHGSLLKDADGHPVKVIGLVEDIGPRKEAEKQLSQALFEVRQARDLLQTTLSSIGDGVVATDAEGRVTFLNNEAGRICGWSHEDALGRPIDEVLILLEEDSAVRIENPVTLALRDGIVVGLADHTILAAKDGRSIPLDDSAAPIRNSEGNIVGAVLIFRDITQRRAAERRMSDSEEFARSIFESSSDCVKVLDLDGRMLSMNRGGCQQMEIDDFSTCLYRYWPEFWSGEEREKAERAFEAARRGELSSFEGFCPTAKGTPRWWEVIVSPIRDSSGEPIRLLSVSRDITERKRIQGALQLAHEQLEASATELRRSNEDLSHFAHVASHDLRSPLNTVLQFTQLIDRKHGEQLGAEGKQFISFVIDGAKRMSRLIEDLLLYAKMTSDFAPPVKAVDANIALESAVANLQSAIIESKATIVHDHLPMVAVDETRLVQIFQNLVGNAIHYRGKDVPQVHISAREQKTEWQFLCRDNGIGIETQFQEQIFEPFKRLHGVELPGSGIGLAVCKKVIERYHGRIWVESIFDQGSTFIFTAPKPFRG